MPQMFVAAILVAGCERVSMMPNKRERTDSMTPRIGILKQELRMHSLSFLLRARNILVVIQFVFTIAVAACLDQTGKTIPTAPSADVALPPTVPTNTVLVLFRKDVSDPLTLAASLVRQHGGVLG